MSVEVRRQEKLDRIEKKNFKREKLSGKYMVKMLYGWNDGKFEEEYLRKLERNWQKWKSVSLKEKLWRRVMSKLKAVDSIYFHFPFFLFLFLKHRVRVRVIISCCHKSVTSDHLVTVTITGHKIYGRI